MVIVVTCFGVNTGSNLYLMNEIGTVFANMLVLFSPNFIYTEIYWVVYCDHFTVRLIQPIVGKAIEIYTYSIHWCFPSEDDVSYDF